VVQVETDCVVPVEAASDHAEYAARTLRPKINRQLSDYLRPLQESRPRHDSLGLPLGGLALGDIGTVLQGLRLDRKACPPAGFVGGASHARRLLSEFARYKLPDYHERRNDPALDHVSHLAPYLHFGQISPLEVALEVARHSGPGRQAFLEELIVRRELSLNFVHFEARYDSYEGLPE
jgi:deoxyribodipyrimidine photo-lyase